MEQLLESPRMVNGSSRHLQSQESGRSGNSTFLIKETKDTVKDYSPDKHQVDWK